MIDLLLVLIFVAYSVFMGFRARRKASRNLRSFFLASGEVAGWKAGISMAATQYAADTPLLATGLVATGGIFLLWRFWIYGFGFLLLAFVFAECWRHARVLTDAELTELRYSGRGVLTLRILKAVYYGTVVNCFFLAIVLIAAVRIAEVFLPWHEWMPSFLYDAVLFIVKSMNLSLGTSVTGLPAEFASANGLISILLIVTFVLLYSAVGCLRAVVDTDVMQFVFITIGTVVYAILVVIKVGGLSEIGPRLVSLYGQVRSSELLALMPSESHVLFPFLMLLGLQGLFWISSDGTGYLAQRSMACRSDHDARLAGVVFSWVQILVRSLLWLVIGVGLLVLYPFTPEEAAAEGFAAARELTFVTGIKELLPVGLRGIMITGILAALASTVDTHLNWGASYWSNDIYDRLLCQVWMKREPRGRELVWVARLSNVVILIVALIIMVNMGSIQATWFVSLVFGAGIGGVLMLRWLWDRINLYSEIAAIATSLVVAPLILSRIETEWIRLGIIVAASMGAAVGITYITPATDKSVLQNFYTRVRPVGWWKSIGAGTNTDVREFRRRLKFTGLMTISLFLILVGLVRILIPLQWISILWGWGALFLGAALAPLWWRSLRAGTFDAFSQDNPEPQVGADNNKE
jgi:Na+/proline symporter